MSPLRLDAAYPVRGVKQGNGGIKSGQFFVVPCDLLLERYDAACDLGALFFQGWNGESVYSAYLSGKGIHFMWHLRHNTALSSPDRVPQSMRKSKFYSDFSMLQAIDL